MCLDVERDGVGEEDKVRTRGYICYSAGLPVRGCVVVDCRVCGQVQVPDGAFMIMWGNAPYKRPSMPNVSDASAVAA